MRGARARAIILPIGVVSHGDFFIECNKCIILYWFNSQRISEAVNDACQSDGRSKIDLQYHIIKLV